MRLAILTFDLDNEGGDYEFRMAVNGHRYMRVIDELDNRLRNATKHSDETERRLALLDVRDMIREELADQGVGFED